MKSTLTFYGKTNGYDISFTDTLDSIKNNKASLRREVDSLTGIDIEGEKTYKLGVTKYDKAPKVVHVTNSFYYAVIIFKYDDANRSFSAKPNELSVFGDPVSAIHYAQIVASKQDNAKTAVFVDQIWFYPVSADKKLYDNSNNLRAAQMEKLQPNATNQDVDFVASDDKMEWITTILRQHYKKDLDAPFGVANYDTKNNRNNGNPLYWTVKNRSVGIVDRFYVTPSMNVRHPGEGFLGRIQYQLMYRGTLEKTTKKNGIDTKSLHESIITRRASHQQDTDGLDDLTAWKTMSALWVESAAYLQIYSDFINQRGNSSYLENAAIAKMIAEKLENFKWIGGQSERTLDSILHPFGTDIKGVAMRVWALIYADIYAKQKGTDLEITNKGINPNSPLIRTVTKNIETLIDWNDEIIKRIRKTRMANTAWYRGFQNVALTLAAFNALAESREMSPASTIPPIEILQAMHRLLMEYELNLVAYKEAYPIISKLRSDSSRLALEKLINLYLPNANTSGTSDKALECVTLVAPRHVDLLGQNTLGSEVLTSGTPIRYVTQVARINGINDRPLRYLTNDARKDSELPAVYSVVAEIHEAIRNGQPAQREIIETWIERLSPANLNEKYFFTPPAALSMRLRDALLRFSGLKAVSVHCLMPLVNSDRLIYALTEAAGYHAMSNTGFIVDTPTKDVLQSAPSTTAGQVVRESLRGRFFGTNTSTVFPNDTPETASLLIPNITNAKDSKNSADLDIYPGRRELGKSLRDDEPEEYAANLADNNAWADRIVGAIHYDYAADADNTTAATICLVAIAEPLFNAAHFPLELLSDLEKKDATGAQLNPDIALKKNTEKRQELVYTQTHRHNRHLAALGRALSTYFSGQPIKLTSKAFVNHTSIFLRNLLSNVDAVPPHKLSCAHDEADTFIIEFDKAGRRSNWRAMITSADDSFDNYEGLGGFIDAEKRPRLKRNEPEPAAKKIISMYESGSDEEQAPTRPIKRPNIPIVSVERREQQQQAKPTPAISAPMIRPSFELTTTTVAPAVEKPVAPRKDETASNVTSPPTAIPSIQRTAAPTVPLIIPSNDAANVPQVNPPPEKDTEPPKVTFVANEWLMNAFKDAKRKINLKRKRESSKSAKEKKNRSSSDDETPTKKARKEDEEKKKDD